MDRVCCYLRLGLWELAEGLHCTADSESMLSEIKTQQQSYWQTILNAEHRSLYSPIVCTPWQQIQVISSIVQNHTVKRGGDYASLIKVETRKKMAEFQCVLSSLSTKSSDSVFQNLCDLYDLVLHAEKSKGEVEGLSEEAQRFLCRSLMKDAISTNKIIQCLLCLWCPVFARTDKELQELYAESLRYTFDSLKLKSTFTVGDSGLRTENSESNLEINIPELLLILSLFEVSQENEPSLMHWIASHLLKIYKTGVISQEIIYLTLLSRFKLKVLKSLSNVEDRYYCDIIHSEDTIVLQEQFTMLDSADGQYLVDIFQITMATKIHWIQYIIDTCTKLIMTESSGNRPSFSDHPVTRKILPLLSINLWCNFIDKSGVFDVLSFLVEECRKFKTDPVFSHMHGVLEHQMLLVTWCKKYGRNTAMQSNDVLHLVRENSTLEVIRRTTNLARIDWEKVTNILVQSHRQEQHSFGIPLDLSSHWDVVTFDGFCILMMAFQIIQRAIEIEKRASLKHTSNDADLYNGHEVPLQRLYAEGVAEKIQEMQRKLSHTFPLDIRVELLEDIFSLLFLCHEHLEEGNSSDSGAEEGEDYEDRRLEHLKCGLSSDSSGRNTSQYIPVPQVPPETEVMSSFVGEFSEDCMDIGFTPANNTQTVPELKTSSGKMNEINGSTCHLLTGYEPKSSISSTSVPKSETVLPVSLKKEYDDKQYQNLQELDKKTHQKRSNKCEIYHGFVCGVNVTRDILHCLKDCIVNTSATFYSLNAQNDSSSLHNDMIQCSVPVDSLQSRLNRLAQCVSESLWRLQLLTDVNILAPLGQFQLQVPTESCLYSSVTWQYSTEEYESESEDETEIKELSPVEAPFRNVPRRQKSETEKSSDSQSTAGGISAGHCHLKTRHQKQTTLPPVYDSIITRMLSSKSSLVVQCLTKGDFVKAKQVIQMCDMEDTPLAIDVNFTEAYQTLREKLKISAEGNIGVIQALNVCEGPGNLDFQQRNLISTVPSLQSIRQVATAGVHSTSLTSEVERFLSVNSLPVVQGIKEIKRDFPQVVNMVNIADSGIGLATMDLALTVGITYEHSVSLLDLVCKHCPDLRVAGIQGSSNGDTLGLMQFMQNMIQILKIASTEHCKEMANSLLSHKMSLHDLLSSVHSFLSPKSVREHNVFWNTIFTSVKDFMESVINSRNKVSFSRKDSPEAKEIPVIKEHSAFRKLMTEIGTSLIPKESQIAHNGEKFGISYLEWLYTYLKFLSVYLVQNVVPSEGFVSPPTYFSLLGESVVSLFGRLVFEHEVLPMQLEPVARNIHHNLVYSIVRNCCPIIPDRPLDREAPQHEVLKNKFALTWGRLILNDSEVPYDGPDLHPEVAVRTWLSDLLEVLSDHTTSGMINREVASSLISQPKIQQVLSATCGLCTIDLRLLDRGDEMLTFFINITNLLWIHSLLVLECSDLTLEKEEENATTFGLLSTCPLKRLICLKCVGYKVGQLGFISLYTLHQLLIGKELLFPFEQSLKSLVRNEKDNDGGKGVSSGLDLSADPRSLFVLTNGQKDSPKAQVMSVEDIDRQLDEAMVEYLDHNVTFSNTGCLIIPHLLQCYQEVVNLNQEPESSATLPPLARPGSPNYFSSDTDSVEKKSFSSKENLLHLMDFVRDNTRLALQKKLLECSKLISSVEIGSAREYVIIMEPSYEFSIVLDYCESGHLVLNSESPLQNVRAQSDSWQKIVVPDIVYKFLESHCWLLSILVHKIHLDERELTDSFSEVQTQDLDDRTRYVSHLFSAEWVTILKTIDADNSETTALTPAPVDKLLWDSLNKLVQDRQWKICQEILWALPETILQSDSKLQALNDVILSELASKLPDKDCSNPWQFSHYIGDVAKQAECVLRNLPLWPGSACLDVLRALMEDNCRKLPECTRYQLELNFHKIQIYDKILSCCSSSDMKCWYDVSCTSESDPGLILKQLYNAKKFQLCLQWAHLHGIHNRFQQLIDYKFLLLLLDQEPPDFTTAKELLLDLSPSQAVRICNDVVQQLKNLLCINFVIKFLLDTFSSVLQPAELSHYRLMSVGVQMLALMPSGEQSLFWDLIGQPQLIVEQLIMNTRLKLLESMLKVLHPVLSQFPINSPVSVNKIDSMLREYATKALDFRVRQAQASSWTYPREEKLLVSLSVASSHSEEFLMPSEVPSKTDWVPNDEVSQCMCCKSVNFSMFNRRHHCRRCGRVICAICSHKRMKVAGYRDVNVRVCNGCYEQTHQQTDVLTGSSQLEYLLESSSVNMNMWKLTLDESHNLTVREEFGFEHAPSVSLCLSILQLHSEQTAYPRFLVDSCDRILRLLQPVGPGTVNPEVDHGLVIRMVRSLVVAAKVKYARYGLNTGVVACDQLLSQVDLLSMLVKSGCSALIPAEPLNGKVLRRLRDRLVKEEMWTVAMEVSTKSGLDRAGVWAAWGKACLQAGCWEEAREKFSHCLERFTPELDSTRPLRNPPLLNEIVQILESGAYSVDRNILQQREMIKPSKDTGSLFGFSSSALSVLHKLSSLKGITQGKYNEGSPPSNTIIIGPKLDPVFYSECCYYLNTYGSNAGIVAFYLSHDDLPAALQYVQNQMVDADTFLETIYMPCLIQGNTSTLHQEMSQMDSSLGIWKSYLCHVCHHLERKLHLNVLYQLQLYMQDYVRAAMTCIRFYQSGARSYSDLARNITFLQLAQSHLEKELGALKWRGKGEQSTPSASNLKMKLEPRQVDRHVNTVVRQIEVTKFLSKCEEQERPGLELLHDLFPNTEAQQVPTLFGNSVERFQLAVLAILCGKNVEEGFGIAFRIIQDYHLKALKIFSLVGRKLASDSRLNSVEQLIGCIQSSGMSDVNSICDEVLLECAQMLSTKPDQSDIDSIVRLMTDVANKVTAYIECKQLKSAYLLAVKHDRLGDVRRIHAAAVQFGQTAIQKICSKRLDHSSSS